MSRPTIAEISGFLADLAAGRDFDPAPYAELMARKADLLERIAADMPGDTEATEVAALARARADQLQVNS